MKKKGKNTKRNKEKKKKNEKQKKKNKKEEEEKEQYKNHERMGKKKGLHVGFTIGCQQALAAGFSLLLPNFITGQFCLIFVPVHVFPLPVYPGLQAQRYEPIVLEHCAFI